MHTPTDFTPVKPASGTPFTPATAFAAVPNTTVPPFQQVWLGRRAVRGAVRQGDVVYYVMAVPQGLGSAVVEAHSCTGDVDLVVNQVALPVPLDARAFPTAARFSWFT